MFFERRRDWTQQYFDEEFGLDWAKRIKAIDDGGEGFGKLYNLDVSALKEEYHFNYLIVPIAKVLNFEALLSTLNEGFIRLNNFILLYTIEVICLTS